MRRPLLPSAVILAAGFMLAAGPAATQSWGHNGVHSHRSGGSSRPPSAFDWRSQLDRPGDYRCDAFWDASRTDCHARWRDQRHRVSAQARRDHRALAGYGVNHGRHGQAWGYDGRYSTRRRGHGDAYSYGYGHGSAGTAWHGAYGRPDIVFPQGHRPAAGGGRDRDRIDWCRATYRSYDAHSGYYRAYSGRMIFCG